MLMKDDKEAKRLLETLMDHRLGEIVICLLTHVFRDERTENPGRYIEPYR